MKNLIFFLILLFIMEGGAFAMKEIKLPEPSLKGKMPLETAIYKRRSVRSYTSKDLTLNQLSQLLWAAQGITEKKLGLRSAPSAGALYPMTVYLVKKSGVFEYVPAKHILRQIYSEDMRENLATAALGQGSIARAPVVLVIMADKKITESTYGSRTDAYIALEAGHIAQNILLQATAIGLAGVPIGAFYDSKVKNLLNLGKDPVYIIPIGYAAP